MKLKTGVLLLLASLLFATPACAYQLVSIPPNGLYLIVCGNGDVFPWQTAGPNGVDVMNGVAIGLCRGTLVTNSHFHVNRADVRKLLLEQKPRTFSERAGAIGRDAPPARRYRADR